MVNNEEVIQGARNAWTVWRETGVKLENRDTDAYPPDLIKRLLALDPESDVARRKLALDQLRSFYHLHFGETGAVAAMQLVAAEESYHEVAKAPMKDYGVPLELAQAGQILDSAQKAVDDLLGDVRVTQGGITHQASSLPTVCDFLAKRVQAHANLFTRSKGGRHFPKPANQSH